MELALLVSLPWMYSPHWWRNRLWIPETYLLVAVVLVSFAVAVVVHEFGHLVVALAVGVKVRGFRLGAEDSSLIRLSVGSFRLLLGLPTHGAVQYLGMPSAWRRASITLAGPLADEVLAWVVFAERMPVKPPIVHAFAAALAVYGLMNLMPFRARAGQLSDGARLFSARADVRAQRMGAELLKLTRGGSDSGEDQVMRILAAYRKGDRVTRTSIGEVASTLRKEGRSADLLELHRGLGVPRALMSVPESTALVSTTLRVAFLDKLSQQDADLAEQRLGVLLRYHDLEQLAETIANYSLAMLRLRRRQYADVEKLCKPALALKDCPPAMKNGALAMVIVARQGLKQSYEDVCGNMADLNRNMKKALLMIREITGIDDETSVLAAVKEFKADPAGPVKPERTDRLMTAYREGNPVARANAGDIGSMLRAEQRIGELLEIHAGHPLPSGPLAVGDADSMIVLETNVASLRDLHTGVYELTASRMEWMLDSYPFEGERAALLRATVRWVLALARLRQGRFDEVEPLCADVLALTSVSVSARAEALATIALARRALGQPHEDLLAQAVSLNPDADLVKEASAAVP